MLFCCSRLALAGREAGDPVRLAALLKQGFAEGAMPDSPQNRHPPDSFADTFFGWNPFPADDPRHGLWETNARYAVEERDRLKAELLKNLPAEGAATHEWLC